MVQRYAINADGWDELREYKSNDGEWVKSCDVSDLEARNAQLEQAVRKAHEILLHEMDNGRTPVMLRGVGLGYFEDIIAGIS